MTGQSETHTTADAMEANALPPELRAREMRADGKDHTPPMPEKLARAAKQMSAAEWAHRRLVLYLKAFEETLDPEQEAAMGFTDAAGGLMRIEGLGFHAPDIVTFSGVDGAGMRVQSIQHVSQLNVLLRAVPRPTDRPEAQRIGFRLARALEEEEAAESAADLDATSDTPV
ncbi:hypothetical protein JSE7799_03072 [Jannaschia seosinensis]|uniref:Uncharacterized protein n=1 Tax=Jannaschia seosinensis TaxID=313367 RepID=A0A0M7BC80_9RHOB|nr:hypothetical protein [Jannaschia seosinensis]CUH40340.1 hypothetical protein JSE7799_03072 [Jannaschia seosinensis]